jgi:hypothetical protein
MTDNNWLHNNLALDLTPCPMRRRRCLDALCAVASAIGGCRVQEGLPRLVSKLSELIDVAASYNSGIAPNVHDSVLCGYMDHQLGRGRLNAHAVAAVALRNIVLRESKRTDPALRVMISDVIHAKFPGHDPIQGYVIWANEEFREAADSDDPADELDATLDMIGIVMLVVLHVLAAGPGVAGWDDLIRHGSPFYHYASSNAYAAQVMHPRFYSNFLVSDEPWRTFAFVTLTELANLVPMGGVH